MTTTIIGAGPTGCYTALKLAKKGIPVKVVEEHEKVGVPFQCTGLVSKNLEKVLKFPEKHIINKINSAKLFFPNCEPVEFKGSAFVLDRINFDNYIYEEATLNGVEFFLKEKYEYFERNFSLKVKTNKRTIDSKMLIGADGPFSQVANQIGIANRYVTGLQVRAIGEFEEDKVELHFGPQYPGFFAWVVPESNKIARIGVATKDNVADVLKEFLKNKTITKAIDKQGGAIPIDLHNSFVDRSVALVGDAAAQNKATTGGGITTGLQSADILVNAVDKCYNEDNFSKGFLEKEYVLPWKKGVGKELRKAYMIRKIINSFTEEDFSEFYKIANDKKLKEKLEKKADMEMYSKFVNELVFHPKVFTFLMRIGLRKPFFFKNALDLLF